jgi:hypothetical protein
MRLPLAMLLLLLTTGCARSATVDVVVKNATDSPLTIGLVKYGAPLEPAWASPEDLAIASPGRTDARWGGVLQPGKIVSIRQTGTFERGALAFLRVYAGEHTLVELLAMSHRDADRLDLPLTSGLNRFVISDRQGQLAGERIERPAQ